MTELLERRLERDGCGEPASDYVVHRHGSAIGTGPRT